MKDKWESVEAAYQNDNTFRTVVDEMEAMLHRADLTPYEIRSAAVLAAIHYEQRTIRSFRVEINSDGLKELRLMEQRIEDLRRWIEPQLSSPYRTRGT